MRRRLRRQRRVREALLLDLGALVYELHRQGQRAPELLQEKAGELGAVDDEVRGLEKALGEAAGLQRLLATGIVGSCAACGALLNSDDEFCARCGEPARVRDGGPPRELDEEPPGEPTDEPPGELDEEPLDEDDGEPLDEDDEAPPREEPAR